MTFQERSESGTVPDFRQCSQGRLWERRQEHTECAAARQLYRLCSCVPKKAYKLKMYQKDCTEPVNHAYARA
nr:MAG TPA: hypothetical protein [Caudoviricetes sp.]